MKVIMGAISPTQEAMLDRALIMTYKAKGITNDPVTQTKEPPLMEDLYKTLIGMEVPDALDLALVLKSLSGVRSKEFLINKQTLILIILLLFSLLKIYKMQFVQLSCL